jgi:ABC-2 type transport system permease protein
MNKLIPQLTNSYFRLGLSIVVVIAAAWFCSIYYHRFDLTSEKRYTLSPFTKETLQHLNQEVRISIYLDGELNIPFHKMKQRLKETMEDFQVYAGKKLQYEFINPFAGDDKKKRDKFLNTLIDKGLRPTNILDKDKEGGSVEKLVIPGALIHYRENEIPVNLLKNNPGTSAEENINNSMETFEFEFMRIISSLVADTTEKIAFVEGHGEYNEYEVADITNELGWNFQVDRGGINGKPGILDQYKAVIIAGPTKAFSEQDKFVLDQYLMKGGKVLWFVDMISASLDSISSGSASMAMIRSLNIEDLLFRYGVRVNPVLLQDVQCSMIPVNVALAGNSPEFKAAPWLYFPLLAAPYNNVITRNLNMIKTEFTGSIDTLASRVEINKTVLLKTSQYSRQVTVPAVISLDEIRITPRQQDFSSAFMPVVVLLQGNFESAFRNRMISGLFPDTVVKLTEKGIASSVLVAADANIIRNEISPGPKGIRYMPLGFDRYTSQTYGNKEFIVNAIQYMTGHKGLIYLRSKKLTIRLLDKSRIKKERLKWVMINTIVPPLLVIFVGLLYVWFRKRKFTVV